MSTVKDVVRFLTFVHDGNISCIEPVIFESPNLHICIRISDTYQAKYYFKGGFLISQAL